MAKHRRSWLWWVAGILVALCVLWFLKQEVEPEISGADFTNDLDRKVKEAEQQKGAPLDEAETLALLPKKLAAALKTAAQMDVEDVRFYARVVDQYGAPVPNAYLRASVMGSMLGGYTAMSGHANATGGLRLDAKGGAITIMALQKPGYVYLAAECYSQASCGFSDTDYFAAVDKQPHEKTWYDHQTPATAYTFRMHKLGHVEGGHSDDIGIVSRTVGIWRTSRLWPRKGNPQTWSSEEPDFQGHLRFRKLEDSGDAWKVEIQAVDGGIQLAAIDDAYMSIAPQDGYQDTYVFDCTTEDRACINGAYKRFYFHSHNRQEYGALAIKIFKSIEGRYRINTKGGRDLSMADIKQFDLSGQYR